MSLLAISKASLRGWLTVPLTLLALAIAGCGGGGGDSASANNGSGGATAQQCTSASCGDVMVALTDADGDFLSYTVDVVSLKLKKASGEVVETLPNTTRVDFAQLVDLTEFFSAATIPNGTYVEGTIRLDYSNADVTVEVNGEPRAATVVGEDGQPLGTVDLQIMLDDANHVVVAPGRPAFLQLDFDLAATHTVDTSVTPARATAEPIIVASIEPVTEKEMRVRGPLLNVDTAASTYTIDVRPFFHRTARFGKLKVHTTADTAFEIDGVPYTGAAGLSALGQLDDGAATAAFGTFDRETRTFTAERVHAGTSEPGDRFDVLWGNVTARQGDTLTVRGGTLIRKSGNVSFVRGNVTVQVGAATKVTRDGMRGSSFDEDDLSVGQRLNVFGQVSENSPGNMSLDATAGRARMQMTHLWGTVKSSIAGLLTLNLDAIDDRRVSIFNFAGTGMVPATDADPANYEVATGALDLSLFPVNAPTRVFGFVTPFGTAAPDFDSRTVVDFDTVRASLVIGWGLRGTAAPFVSLDNSGIVLDPDNASIGARHHVRIGPRAFDLTALSSGTRIMPSGEHGLYAIAAGRRVDIFADFGRFTTRLSEKLGAGGKALSMTASGKYDTGSNTLNAREVHVVLTN